MEQLIIIFGYAGIVVFAISGSLAAMRQGLDPFGMIVIAVVTSMGGGTLRDILLGLDVYWVLDPTMLYIAIITSIITPFWGRLLESRITVLIWADAVGMALFAVTGAAKAMDAGASNIVIIMMGMMTAAAGGIIRDILCNEIPLIFRKELYAVPALMGGVSLIALHYWGLDGVYAISISCLITLIIRAVAIIKSLSLPPIGHVAKDKKEL